MLEQIFKNLFSRKPVLPYPEGFKLKPEEEAIVVELKQKIDAVFGRSLGLLGLLDKITSTKS
jgi:hypothetical protein